jgi:hypothetical protein
MAWLAVALCVAGGFTIGASLAARLAGHLAHRPFMACCALTNALNLIACVIADQTGAAGFLAGALALSLWSWWNAGGGDGTKRRLRSWGRKFRGVRRTAPVGSAS